MSFTITNPELQEKVNEYLETLQSCSRSFLIGAGCSKCAKLPFTGELADLVKAEMTVKSRQKEILEIVIKNFTATPNITIEEYISEIVDYAAILERRVEKGSAHPTIDLEGNTYNEKELKSAVIEIQKLIVKVIDKDFELKTHIDFIKTIHYRLDNGKSQFSTPTNYFVLNYDTLIEDALSMNKINYADGFRGGAIGWWDTSVFEDKGIKARLFKLHGSLDWCVSDDDKLPRRLKQKSKHPAYNFNDNVLIYPCATKYKETQNDPFAQLLNYYRKILKENDKAVLTICGYRFADNHINIEIEKALSDAKNLTVIIFTEADTPNDNPILKGWFENKEFKPHIKFFTKKGFYHNDIMIEDSGKDIDWWKFEVLTEILNK
jgi:hypothetical protein